MNTHEHSREALCVWSGAVPAPWPFSGLPLEPALDLIGLAGSGEPALHSRTGDLIAGTEKMTGIPVAVLTNGSMLWMPEVRAGLVKADLVLPSLDAGDQQSFERVNRPPRDIAFDRMTEGLIAFAEGYRGAIWLEVRAPRDRERAFHGIVNGHSTIVIACATDRDHGWTTRSVDSIIAAFRRPVPRRVRWRRTDCSCETFEISCG